MLSHNLFHFVPASGERIVSQLVRRCPNVLWLEGGGDVCVSGDISKEHIGERRQGGLNVIPNGDVRCDSCDGVSDRCNWDMGWDSCDASKPREVWLSKMSRRRTPGLSWNLWSRHFFFCGAPVLFLAVADLKCASFVLRKLSAALFVPCVLQVSRLASPTSSPNCPCNNRGKIRNTPHHFNTYSKHKLTLNIVGGWIWTSDISHCESILLLRLAKSNSRASCEWCPKQATYPLANILGEGGITKQFKHMYNLSQKQRI